MERTESKIIEIAPKLEQDTINTMAKFGWSLQNRQEIQIHSGKETKRGLIKRTENYRRDYQGNLFYDGAYEIVTTSIIHFDHYTKLHFSRAIAFRENQELNKLEQEYFLLRYAFVKKVTGWLVLGIIFAVLAVFSFSSNHILAIIFGAVSVLFFYLWNKKKQKPEFNPEAIREHNEKAEKRGQEILNKAEELVVQIEKKL